MPYIVLDPTTATVIPAGTLGVPRTSYGKTLADFRAELREELGNRSDIATNDVRVDNWINKAYRYVCSIITVKESFAPISFSLVAGQPLYLLPDAVSWVKDAALADTTDYPISGGSPLTPMDLDTYRKLPENTQGLPEFPTAYFREGRMLVIYPTPTAVQTVVLNVKVRPKPMTGTTDSPYLPEEFHDSILLRAKHVGFRALKAYTEAGIARNDFVSDIETLEDADSKEEVQASVRPARSERDLRRMYGNSGR